MGNRPYELSTYQLSGKRHTPSFLQGHPSSLRFGHPDVTTGDTAFLTPGHSLGVPCPSSAPAGNPPSQSSGTLMSLPEGIATPLGFHGSWPGRAIPFLRSCREPALAELGHPDVASGRDSYARGSLNRCEAHPVLARQLLIRLHKPACTRTRRTIDAHTLITHRLKQAQQLRGHIGCRK